MAPKPDLMRQLERRKSAREYENWATSKGANWAQAYKMAPPDIRKGMLARRIDKRARGQSVMDERKASIANKFQVRSA